MPPGISATKPEYSRLCYPDAEQYAQCSKDHSIDKNARAFMRVFGKECCDTEIGDRKGAERCHGEQEYQADKSRGCDFGFKPRYREQEIKSQAGEQSSGDQKWCSSVRSRCSVRPCANQRITNDDP